MNGDEIGSLVRQVLTAVLSTTTAATYVSHDQTVALAAGAATLASIAWSVYAHWDMKKVPAGRNCLKMTEASTDTRILSLLTTIHANQLVMFRMIETLQSQETNAMAAIDDLNAAVTTLTTNAAAADAAIQAEIAALQTALAGGDSAAIEAAVANISAASAKLASDTSALAASLPPAPSPT